MTTPLVPLVSPRPLRGLSAKAKFTLSHTYAANHSATSVVLQRDPAQSILARRVSACDGKNNSVKATVTRILFIVHILSVSDKGKYM